MATLFGISTDVLFGITPDAMEKEIAEARARCKLPETTNEEAFRIWTELYKRYPHNNHIRFEIANTHMCLASGEQPREVYENHFRTAAEYFEKILDESTDNELRSNTIYLLHDIYNVLGDLENVLRISNMGGEWGTLKAEMLSKIDGFEEKTFWCQEVFRYCGEGAAWALRGMRFPDDETKIFAYETAIKILDLVYCDGNKAWVSYVYIYLHIDLAWLYAKAEKYDDMWRNLNACYELAEFEDNLTLGEYRYPTNPFLNQIVYNHDLAFTHNQRDCLAGWLENKSFDKIRDDEKFIAFAEKVNAMPGIEFPW